MMAKITKGSSFGGCVKYVLTKKEARLIMADGVCYTNHGTIAESFDAQSSLNPRLGKMVGHISLNFSVQDKHRIDNAFMRKVAYEYMQRMDITDTQFIVVRHSDREHPHCHIVFNRVNNFSQTIADRNDRHRSVKVCRELTEKHALYLKLTDAKQNVKRDRLRRPDKIKYEIYDAIKAALSGCNNWAELENRLKDTGIVINYKHKGSTGEIEGIVFAKSGQSFNGSKIDRQFSFSKLNAALNPIARRHLVIKPKKKRGRSM